MRAAAAVLALPCGSRLNMAARRLPYTKHGSRGWLPTPNMAAEGGCPTLSILPARAWDRQQLERGAVRAGDFC